MSKLTTLFENKWLNVQEKELDNGAKYVYSSAPWCGSEGVAILPFRSITSDGFSDIEFLGRYEINPAHSEQVELCAITGGMDKEGESPVFTAVRELIEEGGYEVPVENMIYLGTVRPSKSTDSTQHLFAVDIDKGAKEVKATGDGTLGEVGAYCAWINTDQLVAQKDPLLHTILIRAIQNEIL